MIMRTFCFILPRAKYSIAGETLKEQHLIKSPGQDVPLFQFCGNKDQGRSSYNIGNVTSVDFWEYLALLDPIQSVRVTGRSFAR